MAGNRERGLGRGLSALMADVNLDAEEAAATPPQTERMLPVEALVPNPEQPRRDFPAAELDELAASLEAKGVIQPLIVRPDPEEDGRYQIVAGERRWRAAQRARLHEVPVILRQLDDTEVLEVAIIENIQRASLNPMEEAMGYRQLMERFGHTQERLATALSKSRSHIANLMRLLNLPGEVQIYVHDGKLSAGHARALLTAEDPAALARKVIARGLSVREAEKLVAGGRAPRRATGKAPAKDADTQAMERDLAAALSLGVSIDHKPGQEAGAVTIRYRSLEQLDGLCRRLSGSERDL